MNNAAVFRAAAQHTAPVSEVLDLIVPNLHPAVVGCHRGPAVPAGGHRGRDRQRVVAPGAARGPLPYVTAKAAVEGLTRALAADHGPAGIRVNAVAPGSIRTERHDAGQDPEEV